MYQFCWNKSSFQAYPGRTEDSLVRRASQSLRTSRELQTKGEGLKTTVTQQLSDLEKQQRALGTAKGILDISESRIDSLNTLMETHFTAG